MNNWRSGLAVDFPLPTTLPTFCFPDIIEKAPINLIYCILYMIGCAAIMASGFFLYFRRNYHLKLMNNEHSGDKHNIEVHSEHKGPLRRMFSGRSDSDPQHTELSMLNGDQRVPGKESGKSLGGDIRSDK